MLRPRTSRWSPLLALLPALVVGCGSEAPAPASSPDTAAAERLREAPRPTPAADAGPVFDPTDRGGLVELYCRLSLGQNDAWARHGLVDARGFPDPGQVARYQRAIQELADDGKAWQAFEAEVQECLRTAGR